MNSAPFEDPSRQRRAAEVICRDCQQALSLTVGMFDRTFRCPQCGTEQPIPDAVSGTQDIPPRVTPPPLGPDRRGSGEDLQDIVLLDGDAAGQGRSPHGATAAGSDPAPDMHVGATQPVGGSA